MSTPYPTSFPPAANGGTPPQDGESLTGASYADTSAIDTPERGPDGDFLDRVARSAHDAVDHLADSAAPHVQRVQEGLESARDSVRERAGQVSDLGGEWAESLRGTVRENPLAALFTALVAGALLVRLARR